VKPLATRDVQLSVRHRLGLPPDNCLQPACPCGALFKDDPSHLHACPLFRHRPVNARHNILLHTAAALSRSAGFAVRNEPMADLFARETSPDARCHASAVEPRKRGDVLLIDDERTVVIDVSVGHPASRSHALAASRRGGSLANSIAQRKTNKYSRWVRDRFGENATFLPIVFDSFGAYSAHGMNTFVDILAEKAASLGFCSFREFRSHALFVFSTALQRGNAIVSKLALRHFRFHSTRQSLLLPQLHLDDIPYGQSHFLRKLIIFLL
jgi:hypothetical protein